MRVTRNNLIIGHGGKHGKARTLRKGAAVQQADSEAIPRGMTQQLTGTAPHEHGGDRTDRAGPQVKTSAQIKAAKAREGEKTLAKEQQRRVDEAKSKAGPSVPEGKVIQNAGGSSEEPSSEEGEDAIGAAETSEYPADPDKKRDLTVMRKAEVEALAEKHGIEVEEGTKGRTELLRDLIATKLGL